jgi:hypothetical protein
MITPRRNEFASSVMKWLIGSSTFISLIGMGSMMRYQFGDSQGNYLLFFVLIIVVALIVTTYLFIKISKHSAWMLFGGIVCASILFFGWFGNSTQRLNRAMDQEQSILTLIHELEQPPSGQKAVNTETRNYVYRLLQVTQLRRQAQEVEIGNPSNSYIYYGIGIALAVSIFLLGGKYSVTNVSDRDQK